MFSTESRDVSVVQAKTGFREMCRDFIAAKEAAVQDTTHPHTAFDYTWHSLRLQPALEDGWNSCYRVRVGLASLAACARRVVGKCASDMF